MLTLRVIRLVAAQEVSMHCIRKDQVLMHSGHVFLLGRLGSSPQCPVLRPERLMVLVVQSVSAGTGQTDCTFAL